MMDEKKLIEKLKQEARIHSIEKKTQIKQVDKLNGNKRK